MLLRIRLFICHRKRLFYQFSYWHRHNEKKERDSTLRMLGLTTTTHHKAYFHGSAICRKAVGYLWATTEKHRDQNWMLSNGMVPEMVRPLWDSLSTDSNNSHRSQLSYHEYDTA